MYIGFSKLAHSSEPEHKSQISHVCVYQQISGKFDLENLDD